LASASALGYLRRTASSRLWCSIGPSDILFDAKGVAKIVLGGPARTGAASPPDGGEAGDDAPQLPPSCPALCESASGQATEGECMQELGVLMLELLFGAPACTAQHGDAAWPPACRALQAAQPHMPDALERTLEALDSSTAWPPGLARELAEIALACADAEAERRPDCAEVEQRLWRLRDEFCGGGPAAPPSPPRRFGLPTAVLAEQRRRRRRARAAGGPGPLSLGLFVECRPALNCRLTSEWNKDEDQPLVTRDGCAEEVVPKH